ncbi:aminopeptidase P family protein [Aestuariispira ectoiniformans]|uniref:aminopeptidase P family protein n=1 Tax=Aestuariispira ectoiniformans TaxID=2775080 RepID=UPI00223C1EBF|nr:aminopeptidase P family protein [Aestuariispira ectoiniformans]
MTYNGDQALAALLQNSGSTLSVDEVRSLVKGTLAAPDNGQVWMDLVVPDAGEELKQQLAALRDAVANDTDPGFTDGPAPAERLVALRAHMKSQNVDAFLVPRTDEYQGEYVSERADRLLWLTGFSGSAGLAIIGLEKAAIFVDGRYVLQVRNQTDAALFDYRHITQEPATDWIKETFGKGDRIAYDPWLHTPRAVENLRQAVEAIGADLVAVDHNLIDAVWDDQPEAPVSVVHAHDIDYAGETAQSKRERLAETLKGDGVDAAVITASDSVAWLLNIRGTDVRNCPLPLSFAILHNDGGVELFIDKRKMAPGLEKHLGNAVSVQDQGQFASVLEGLSGKTVLADPTCTASFVFERLAAGGAKVVKGDDPCSMPRACKNEVELDGSRAAHKRDGAAVCKFLAWLDEEAPKGNLAELDIVAKLHEFREEDASLRDNSFDTIAGSGPNGAIMHYRVTEKTNRPLDMDSLLLVDSGAQYPDGTTDITRTMPVGTASDEMKERFTLVLKGHIAIACARWPEGVSGQRLDALARAPLWQRGLDFDHGTGHGVGSYLNVHEGPQRIGPAGSAVPLKPGMILSNEPGYYKPEEYGIRIENLVIVRDLGEGEEPGKRLFGFETITLAPIDRRLIDPSLMTGQELDWLNTYHARVHDEIGPLVDDKTRQWLEAVTRPIG